jgi:hypothetical protein
MNIQRKINSTLMILAGLLAGCANISNSRVAVPDSLSDAREESFGKMGWGRRGAFRLHGQTVRYERGADRISLFDALNYGEATLRVEIDLGRTAQCFARQADLSVGAAYSTIKPWGMRCTWQGADAPEGHFSIGEGQLQPATQVREGVYRRGDISLVVRSIHHLEASPLPLQAAVGYVILLSERPVGIVDLSRGVPVLRRPDPTTPLGQAVTEAALTLALIWEPG